MRHFIMAGALAAALALGAPAAHAADAACESGITKTMIHKAMLDGVKVAAEFQGQAAQAFLALLGAPDPTVADDVEVLQAPGDVPIERVVGYAGECMKGWADVPKEIVDTAILSLKAGV